jgi:hypothetical protein
MMYSMREMRRLREDKQDVSAAPTNQGCSTTGIEHTHTNTVQLHIHVKARRLCAWGESRVPDPQKH